MTKDTPIQRTLEEGYFHTGNSGICISIDETLTKYKRKLKNGKSDIRYNYDHSLNIKHSAFGAATTISTPIAGPAMCDFYIDAFTRLKEHMLSLTEYEMPYPFGAYDHTEPLNDIHRIRTVMDGFKVKELWSEAGALKDGGLQRILVAHNLVNEHGQVVMTIPFEGHVVQETDC